MVKRAQRVVPSYNVAIVWPKLVNAAWAKNVTICCAEMLRSFGRCLRDKLNDIFLNVSPANHVFLVPVIIDTVKALLQISFFERAYVCFP